MTMIDILLAVVLVLICALIIFLIIYIGKITSSIEKLQADVSNLSHKLEPLVSSLSDLTSQFSKLGDMAMIQLETAKNVVTSVKERVEKILDFEQKIRAGIEEPISSVLNQIKAISNGVSTFLSYLKK